jgi:hypothetical protein
MKRIIYFILAAIFLGAGLWVYNEYNRGPVSVKNLQADFEVSANQLLEEFDADESKANEKYLDKVVLVTGVILEVEKEEAVNVIMETNDPLKRIICEMQDIEQVEDIQLGDEVKIKAKCSGFLMDVVLVNGVVIE